MAKLVGTQKIESQESRRRHPEALRFAKMPTVLDSLLATGAEAPPLARDCGFCGHFADSADAGDAWRVLFEDELFVAVPSIGALIPGWLLVVPRGHSVNLASMGPKKVERMWGFIDGFWQRWTNEFGRLVVFEHGAATEGRPAGCGVDHAHLHIVACPEIDLVAAARRRLVGLDWAPVTGLSDLFPAVVDRMDYLYLRDDAEELAAVESEIQSQALRQVLAAELGAPTMFNWREHPNLDVVRDTVARAAHL